MRENKTKLIGFREKESIKNELERIADNHDMNLSEFIRYCVYKEINKEE